VRLAGTAHVHSTYSWDGCHPLPELAAFLRGQGLDFVLMSEHDRGLTHSTLAHFVRECQTLSDDRFLIIPGIEYETSPDFVHLLAYNTSRLILAHDAAQLARAIRREGGLAVLAHPHWRDGFRHVTAETLALVHGWEIWNGKADGRWGPDPANLNRYRRLRESRPSLLPFGGADLHRIESYPGLTFEVECRDRTITSIVDALATGTYRVTGRAITFSPAEIPDVSRSPLLACLVRSLPRIKRRAQQVDKWLTHRGVQLPPPLYRAARRLFR
jgi:hypothetical protein